jgi:hypothetical protein
VSVIRDLYDEDSSILRHFRQPAIVAKLLQIGALAHRRSAVLPLVYRWVAAILGCEPGLWPELAQVLEEHKPREEGLSSARLANMFQIWPHTLARAAVPLFFSDPPFSDSLNAAFVAAVRDAKDRERRKLLTYEDDKLLKLIIHIVPAPPGSDSELTLVNGHVVQLALFIADPDENKVVTKFMRGKLWTLFVITRLTFYRMLALRE